MKPPNPLSEALDPQARLQRLAAEKSSLQLVVQMMERLVSTQGVENMVQNLLGAILDVVGGTNIIAYYLSQGVVRQVDVFGSRTEHREIPDPVSARVFVSGTPEILQGGFEETKMQTPEFGKSWTWVFPLKVEGEALGVIRMENLHLEADGLYPHLPAFFQHASLLLKNELLRALSQKKAEQAQRAAEEAAAARSNFLTVASHELRTPLNGILGAAQLMLLSSKNEEEKHLSQTVQTSCQALLTVIQEILDFSHLSGKGLNRPVREIHLRELCQTEADLFEALLEQKRLQLSVEIDPSLPPILWGDGLRLGKILSNLLSNAVKFTDKGSVTLAAQGKLREEGVWWVSLAVTDTGIGIAPKDQELLFTSFTQIGVTTSRRYSGLGLGLSIVKALVETMEGQIRVESEPGLGTKFVVSLPLSTKGPEQVDQELPAQAEPRVALSQVPTVAKEPSIRPKSETRQKQARKGTPAVRKILGVEDDELNQMVIGRMLEMNACQADFAGNGLQALELLQNAAYDLVLMDCVMPVMDGFEATRRNRALQSEGNLPKGLSVVAVTALAHQTDKDRCFQSGMDGYLPKPIQFDALKLALSQFLPAPASP